MTSLPYVTSPGSIDKALTAIKNAAVPDRISQDFVKTILKIPGGSGAQITAFLKKLGLANSDGSPSELYRKFRNPASSSTAIATAIRQAYAPLYLRNEFMHELNETELLGLVVEETGQPHDSTVVKLTVSCIKHLKNFTDFQNSNFSTAKVEKINGSTLTAMTEARLPSEGNATRAFGLNLGYTINLNLPATSDPEVFDAIFKSLKEHMLREEDA